MCKTLFVPSFVSSKLIGGRIIPLQAFAAGKTRVEWIGLSNGEDNETFVGELRVAITVEPPVPGFKGFSLFFLWGPVID